MRLFSLTIFVIKIFYIPKSSVADPDQPDPHFLGLLDPDPLVRGIDPDPAPDPSIIKQKK
jgi:hypothetical protein